MKVIFFGSSDYCLPLLEILSTNYQLFSVITKQASAVQRFALKKYIKVFIPNGKEDLLTLKNDISSLKPDLAIVADYGLQIPPEIFSIPRFQTLNIHFSKLPQYRGPSPVQYTILLGEKSAWISVIIMDKDLDTGDIIWQKEISLIDNATMQQRNIATSESLYRKLFNIVALDLSDVINKYINNEFTPQKQDHTKATYTKHFTRKDGFIPSYLISAAVNGKIDVKINSSDFPKNSILFSTLEHCNIVSLCIERAVRALSPWPGIWTYISLNKGSQDTSDGGGKALKTPRGWQAERSEAMTLPMVKKPDENKRLKILKAHIEQLQYISSQTEVVKLVLDEVQLEGKKPVSWKQFLSGYPNFTFS